MKKLKIAILGTLLLASIAYADTYKITVPIDIDNTINGLHIKSSDGVSHLATSVQVYCKVYCRVNGENLALGYTNKFIPFSSAGIHQDVVFEFASDQGCDDPRYKTIANFMWGDGRTGISSQISRQSVGSNLESVNESDIGAVTKIN